MMELPVKLAAYLGLRRSEICGLRWENVDLEAGLLSIREVRTEVGGSVVLKSPKTRTSARRLGITGLQDLQQVLRRAWERRRSDDPKEWVVLRQDGAPPKPDQLTRDLLTVVRRQGLPKISLHGLPAQLCLGGQQPGRAHVRYLPHPGAQLHDRHQQHLHPPF